MDDDGLKQCAAQFETDMGKEGVWVQGEDFEGIKGICGGEYDQNILHMCT